jgi:hypothetical protein
MTVAPTTDKFANGTRGLSAMSLSNENLARSDPGRRDCRAHFIGRHSTVRSDRRIVPAES